MIRIAPLPEQTMPRLRFLAPSADGANWLTMVFRCPITCKVYDTHPLPMSFGRRDRRPPP